MRVFKTSFSGNPNIGLYVYCTNKYCLVSRMVPKGQVRQIEDILGVPAIHMSAAGTSLLGAFFAGNDNCLLVPDIIFDDEIKVLEDNDINYKIIRTNLTALGNNIASNNSGALINEEFEEPAVTEIKQALKVPVEKAKIAGLNLVGALCIANDKVAIVHEGASKKEIQIVESLLKAKVLAITVELNPFVKAGVVVNNHGYLISENARTIEVSLIDQTLNE